LREPAVALPFNLEPGTSFSGWNAGPLGEIKEVRGGPEDPPRVD
jgi:hypothetical protein